MRSTTVRISDKSRQLLRELASREGLSLANLNPTRSHAGWTVSIFLAE